MRLFTNIPLILLLVGAWPIILMGLVIGCEWLERRTLAAKPAGRRARRRPPRLGRVGLRLRRAAPGRVEDLVLKETAQVVATYLAATGESSPAQHQPSGVPAKRRPGAVPAKAQRRG